MTSIFKGQPPKTRPFSNKTRVIWVLGIYPKDPDPSKLAILRTQPPIYKFKPFHWRVKWSLVFFLWGGGGVKLKKLVGGFNPYFQSKLCVSTIYPSIWCSFGTCLAATYVLNCLQHFLVGGWTNPSEKYQSQIGNLPQFTGWKFQKYTTKKSCNYYNTIRKKNKFPATEWTFPSKDNFSLQGCLKVRMRYPENGWYEENDYYIAFASASFRQKKIQKTFRGLPRLQSGAIFQVLWHNPAYRDVENKWRCSCVFLRNHMYWKKHLPFIEFSNDLILRHTQTFMHCTQLKSGTKTLGFDFVHHYITIVTFKLGRNKIEVYTNAYTVYMYIWVFPKIGVSPNHEF